jgi:CheY-like chemotaxis protein
MRTSKTYAGQPIVTNPSVLDLRINELGRPLQVLIVEDSRIIALIISEMLHPYCQTHHVKSRKRAVQVASQNQYDIILMDLFLDTEMDGITAVREIRKFPGYLHTPVAAVTGYEYRAIKDQLKSADIQFYLRKPFLADRILNLLKTIILHTRRS